MQKWSWGRPGNKARDDPNAVLLVPTLNEAGRAPDAYEQQASNNTQID